MPGSIVWQRPSPVASLRAQADIKTYVLETDELRLELEDVVQVNTRSLDAVIGLPVTFALEKSSVYIRDSDNVEHKLRITKKTSKLKSRSEEHTSELQSPKVISYAVFCL